MGIRWMIALAGVIFWSAGACASDLNTAPPSVVQPPAPYTQLANDLRNAGADVVAGSGINQPFFNVPGRVLTVDGSDVQVFEFPGIEDARSEAAKIAPDGNSIGTSMVNWIASPHFYSRGSVIVLYVGDDSNVLSLLSGVIGRQFAGRVSGEPGHDPVSGEADSAARSQLSGRIGVAPEDLRLTNSQAVEFGNGALGCPDAGSTYTEATVPGFALVYEYEGIRYPFRVSVDGRLSTDCRGKNSVAV